MAFGALFQALFALDALVGGAMVDLVEGCGHEHEAHSSAYDSFLPGARGHDNDRVRGVCLLI